MKYKKQHALKKHMWRKSNAIKTHMENECKMKYFLLVSHANGMNKNYYSLPHYSCRKQWEADTRNVLFFGSSQPEVQSSVLEASQGLPCL